MSCGTITEGCAANASIVRVLTIAHELLSEYTWWYGVLFFFSLFGNHSDGF